MSERKRPKRSTDARKIVGTIWIRRISDPLTPWVVDASERWGGLVYKETSRHSAQLRAARVTVEANRGNGSPHRFVSRFEDTAPHDHTRGASSAGEL